MDGAGRPDPELAPVDYPWAPATAPGVLIAGSFHLRPTLGEIDDLLGAARARGVKDRSLVLGVGSNRSPAVLAAKFARLGISGSLALTPARISGLGVGHSAHVSPRGYIAAAPALDAQAKSDLTMSWLDEAQLAALDVTEPNYERIELAVADHPVTGLLAGRRRFWLYRSRWGLVAGPDGHYQPLDSQAAIQRRLAEIAGLRDVLAGTPASVAAGLTDPEVRQRVHDALRQAGAIVPSGLTKAPFGHPTDPAADPRPASPSG